MTRKGIGNDDKRVLVRRKVASIPGGEPQIMQLRERGLKGVGKFPAVSPPQLRTLTSTPGGSCADIASRRPFAKAPSRGKGLVEASLVCFLELAHCLTYDLRHRLSGLLGPPFEPGFLPLFQATNQPRHITARTMISPVSLDGPPSVSATWRLTV